MPKKIVRKLWNEITSNQQDEFIRQMRFTGCPVTDLKEHVYQINESEIELSKICHGWIAYYKNIYIKNVSV